MRLACFVSLAWSRSSASSSWRGPVPSSHPIRPHHHSAGMSRRSLRQDACDATGRRSAKPTSIWRRRRGPEGRRVRHGGRPRQAGQEPALREGPRRRDAARKKDRLRGRGRNDPPLDRRRGEDRAERRDADAVTQHDVIPILLRRCTACHGLHRQEGGLDLRTKAAMLRGGKSGPAIVPGKPGREPAHQEDPLPAQMPPPDAARRGERQADRAGRDSTCSTRWIAAGAPEVDDRARTSRRRRPTRWSPTRTATSGPSGRRGRSPVPAVRHVAQRPQSDRRLRPRESSKRRD